MWGSLFLGLFLGVVMSLVYVGLARRPTRSRLLWGSAWALVNLAIWTTVFRVAPPDQRFVWTMVFLVPQLVTAGVVNTRELPQNRR